MAIAGAAGSNNVAPYTCDLLILSSFTNHTFNGANTHKNNDSKNPIGTHQLTQIEYGGSPWWPEEEEEAHRVGGGGCGLKARG